MNIKKSTECLPVIVAGVFLLIFFVSDTVSVQASQQSSVDLLIKIMDLHGELVGNEVFLAQAKLLGAYVEAAQPMDEKGKVVIYTKVLSILSKIKLTPIEISTDSSDSQTSTETQSASPGKKESRSVYEPGAALLEIFKADSIETIPALPVIRTYWNRELIYTGGFLVPERAMEIGQESRYVARFSFYFEAKEWGKYGFSVANYELNSCKLIIGGIKIFHSIGVIEKGESRPYRYGTNTAQGVCTLEKGFHRLEFYLFSEIPKQYRADSEKSSSTDKNYKMAEFQLKVLSPDGFDAIPITKNMMLLKKQ
jgi:hypothetical protein